VIKKIKFMKMHGAGNDFILINNNHELFSGDETAFIRQLCHRHLGIGADGFMLIKFEEGHSFHLRYYNADGKESSMCGNGARCAVYFMHLNFPKIQQFTFWISDVKYNAEVLGHERIKLEWNFYPEIKNASELQKIIPPEFSRGLFVNSGVPHLVLVHPDSVQNINLSHWGPFFRNHPFFSPAGTNVNFICFKKDHLEIRTYERGVEAETLACGTGVLATAVAAQFWKMSEFPVTVKSQGGSLQVGKIPESDHLWLEGPVKLVYIGEFNLD
jgi:diaminopimelate epimerase